jgi:hypothetical protein
VTAISTLFTFASLLNPAHYRRRRRAQRSCMHHNPDTGASFLRLSGDQDNRYWCTLCALDWRKT